MLRASFDRELRELQDEVLALGSMVDRAIERSIDALKRLDQPAAREIIQGDLKINQKRFQIEEQAIELIATQQPLARDLRTIVAVLNIIVELE
ncbi:MAG: phosphate transport system regulatory protein PhoU, partial [Chloroflexi bacterium]|nr:phosphate transport system regulatory protein PhoU [Chloroflexota bacterium]